MVLPNPFLDLESNKEKENPIMTPISMGLFYK